MCLTQTHHQTPIPTHIVSDKSCSQWELKAVQREGLGQFGRRWTQCADTLETNEPNTRIKMKEKDEKNERRG